MSNSSLESLIARVGQPRIVVVGDLILDRYITGAVERISPEAPIPVVNATHRENRLGGAGNVAANLRAMDAEVDVIGVLGDDSKGRLLQGMLEELGVDASGCVTDPNRPTTEKTRIIGGSQQVLRVDWEDSAAISDQLARRVVEELPQRVRNAGAVVLSDYGKGALSRVLIQGAIGVARDLGVPVLVDPKGTDYARYKGAHLVTPNRKEAEEALGRRLPGLDELIAGARELIRVADLQAAVITLGAEGMFHLTRDGSSGHIPTVARAVFDVTGAGDTVIATTAAALASGTAMSHAISLANLAAGLVVRKIGVASVTRSELQVALHQRGQGGRGLLNETELLSMQAEARQRGERIVMTNGCFDVLHAGHVAYLEEAKALGDRLIVAVNDDDSVRRLKGEARPINGLNDRMAVLSGLAAVDWVVPFSEDTPARLISAVLPQVLVKGGDYQPSEIAGAREVLAAGGEVRVLAFREGHSSSRIIDRLAD